MFKKKKKENNFQILYFKKGRKFINLGFKVTHF